jgi:hypothetical protein
MRFVYKVAAIAVVFFCALSPAAALAVDVVPPPAELPKTASPLIITGYSLSTAHVGYIQIFNNTSGVVDATGWKLGVMGGPDAQLLLKLDGLIKPGGYIVVADERTVPSADVTYPDGTIQKAPTAITLFTPRQFYDHTTAVKAGLERGFWSRNISEATGNYLSTFSAFTPGDDFVLFGQGFYELPSAPSLQFTEILANPKACSPLETAAECRDYLKLYNASAAAIDLGRYRLRVGYQGQSATASNTYALAGDVLPGHYAVISKSADDREISLTNSGAFIWLEDAYGVQRFDATVQEYPDASAASKKGQAWAYDERDGTWKWTTQPMPYDTPSVFPAAVVKPPKPASTPTPCKEGQYRSEETNRCRNIAVPAALTPCREGQYRSEETNRCRNIATAASANLQPCREGQERNPATNRCRNVASSSLPDAAFAVEPIKEGAKAFAGWWALGGVGALAAGYGAWEWRREMLSAIHAAFQFFTSGK